MARGRSGTEDSEPFAKWLEEALEVKGWTAARLCEMSDITPGYMSQLRSGTRSPSRKAVDRITAALDVDPSVALIAAGFHPGVDDDFIYPDENKQLLIAFYDNASPDRRRLLVKTAAVIAGEDEIEPGKMQPGEMDELPDQ